MSVFDYEDIQLVPNKCIVKSRSEIDTTVKFGPMTFKIPVVPANMQTIIDEPLAIWLAQNGYFYIMHRFEENERVAFVQMMHSKGLFASISVGVKSNEYKLIDELTALRPVPEYITIDVAHGHSDTVIEMIKYIKKKAAGNFRNSRQCWHSRGCS